MKTTKIKVIKEVKPKVKLMSYTMTAIIPTGQYQNIQPSIVVESDTLENAQAYVMPHIEALYKQYFNINENKIEIKASENITVTPVNTTRKVTSGGNGTMVPPKVFISAPTSDKEPKVVTEAYTNAEKAVSGCHTLEALKLIESKIQVSTKLTAEEKKELNFNLMAKEQELRYNLK